MPACVQDEKNRHTVYYATLEKPVGCCYRKKHNNWEVTVSGKYIGKAATLEEAVEMHNKAVDMRCLQQK